MQRIVRVTEALGRDVESIGGELGFYGRAVLAYLWQSLRKEFVEVISHGFFAARVRTRGKEVRTEGERPCDWAEEKNSNGSHVCFQNRTLREHEGNVYSCDGMQCRQAGQRQDEASDSEEGTFIRRHERDRPICRNQTDMDIFKSIRAFLFIVFIISKSV